LTICVEILQGQLPNASQLKDEEAKTQQGSP